MATDHGAPAPGGGGRIGGDLALEALAALGARGVIGLPGQHALGLFDALRRSPLAYLGARVENNAGFMADGASRALGQVVPLLLSTGPGALTSLPALQEAAASSIPILAISAQVPTRGLGGGRHGYLHELPDQSASFRGVVKHVRTVRSLAQVAPAIIEAWRIAEAAPAGPVLVEIPQDLLLEDAAAHPRLEPGSMAAGGSAAPEPDGSAARTAAELLARAERPMILAGGGAVRSGAQRELLALAERLDAPIAETIGGKGTVSRDHPLFAGGWIEDLATTEALEEADVLLVVGSGLGELSSNYHTFRPRGRVVQIEADLGKLGSNHACLGIHADARAALGAILAALPETVAAKAAAGRERASRIVEAVLARLDAQPLAAERGLIDGLRAAVPDGVGTFWDMTIAAYWGWSAWDPRGGLYGSAQGAGGLGYGLPAAIGAAFAGRVRGGQTPTLAVSGDGGGLYSIAELAVLAQEALPVTWLVVDDGGYGVLREYMEDRFGTATATELARPDYLALARSFGLDAVRAPLDSAPEAVAAGIRSGRPNLVLVEAKLELFAPTHLGRLG